jgi:hypothetical protein
MSQASQGTAAPFVAQCTATGTRIATSTANEVVAFYRRRQRLMDTDVEWVATQHPAVSQAPAADDVASVLRALDDDFEDGVPLGVLAAAMDKHGQTIGDTLDDVYDLRMSGSLWEPRADHLRPV